MYVNTFLLRPTELFNRPSYRSFFPPPFLSYSVSPRSFCLLPSPSSLLSLFTFLVSSLTRDASKWITESSPYSFFSPLSFFLSFFFERSDRSRSSRWNAFDKALTNDARDKMHSTHRNFAHLSWFHLVEFRAWSARYQRYVNVSDNRLPIHITVYGGHGSGAFDNTKSQRHDSLMTHTAYLGKNFPDRSRDRSIRRIDQSPPESFIVIFDLISRPRGKF